MTDRVFQDRVSQRHHEVAVDNLAKTMHVARGGVSTLYSIVLRHVDRSARIKHFVSALVTKRVKELLRDGKKPTDIESRRGRHGDF